MSGSLEKIGALAVGLVNGASRRKAIYKALKKNGFLPLGKGAWLGFRSSDVVSGLLVEGSASDIYISSFILPVFDEINFVSWSLGGRIVHCSVYNSADSESKDAIGAYANEIFPVRSVNDMLDYLGMPERNGFYTIWVKYICYLRINDLKKARIYLNDDRKSELHPSILKRLMEIDPYVARDDVGGVAQVLRRWEEVSRVIFGQDDFSFRRTHLGNDTEASEEE